MRVAYRVRQFWQACTANLEAGQLADAERNLPPALFEVFKRMPSSEQIHAIDVYRRVKQRAPHCTELLQAALLHDAGKALHPLGVWERVLIVLVQGIWPGAVERWGEGPPRGWQRPFVVAMQHANWGANLAAQAGASAAVVHLIRHHHSSGVHLQNKEVPLHPNPLNEWLGILKAADNGF